MIETQIDFRKPLNQRIREAIESHDGLVIGLSVLSREVGAYHLNYEGKKLIAFIKDNMPDIHVWQSKPGQPFYFSRHPQDTRTAELHAALKSARECVNILCGLIDGPVRP